MQLFLFVGYIAAYYKDIGISHDLILTMDEALMNRLLKDHERAKNVFTLASYIQADEDISDPYGGSLADYNRVYEVLRVYVLRLSKILSLEESRLQQEPLQ